MTTRGPLSDAILGHLRDLSDNGSGPIWSAQVEGDGYLVIGPELGEHLYVSRNSGPASAADLELMAQARTYLPLLLDEIERLRAAG